MSVGQVQLYNQCFERLLQDADTQWDDAASTAFAFVLAKSSYTPSDAHTTVANLGTSGVDWIASGDGAPIVVPSRVIDMASGVVQLKAGNANFGSSVTITAKYLICVMGTSAAITSGMPLLWYQDLSQEGGSAQSSASDFVVQAPANSIWKQINAQA
jgi:hypothetical protein